MYEYVRTIRSKGNRFFRTDSSCDSVPHKNMGETLSAALRLKRLRERAGLTVRGVAEALDEKHTSYQYYEGGYKKPGLPPKLVNALLKILVGAGEPPITEAEVLGLAGPLPIASTGNAVADGNTAQLGSGITSMEEVDGLLGAGLTTDAGNHVVPVGEHGTEYRDNVRATWGIPTSYLSNELKANRQETKIIEVKGDSMEPTLETGDRVMVDPTERDIASGGIFAIHDGLGMSIRRLEHIPYSEPITVRIISDSPHHGDYERTLEELTIIGRVIWCARRL